MERQDVMMSVEAMRKELDLPNGSIRSKDPRVNVAGFSEKLRTTIRKSLTNGTTTMNVENMLEKAVDLGLSVDEKTSDEQKKAAEEIVKGIGVRHIPDYKKQQLPVQGDKWKSLSQSEKEECRLKNAGDHGLEEYKSQLQADMKQLKQELGKYKLSKAMTFFIEHVSNSDKEKRDFFLKWMKLKLDTHSRNKLTGLRSKFKEHCMTKDVKLIAELEQALLDSSLGIEHYMREMGLIYEFSATSSTTTADEISRLPGVAAEMLLDGYPLELLDGDASNIPERWVTDVLMELHKKVGGQSRLLVLTVLGVQSTGKSTLLNTMFGVQFPVSSGRCTRGAYMLFLRVGEDMQSEMNCDFIVLIDTEGLKSPHLAQLEDSYEHDNQLATFVIGLSDVTMINVAMENSTEMKDVLQIATHAFLRMKQVEIQHSTNNKLDCALDAKKGIIQTQEFQRQYRTVIEERVMKLLCDCKDSTLSNDELIDEFEKMWTEVIVKESGLKEQDVSATVLHQLKRNFLNRNVNEELQSIGDLKEVGKTPFEVKSEHLDNTVVEKNMSLRKYTKMELQKFADPVIESCSRFVRDIARTNRDYHDCFTKDLLDKIDESLKSAPKHRSPQFEIDLKLHMCGIASREFLQMHKRFLLDMDPLTEVKKYKAQYMTDFLDLYQEKDHCQRKANDFVQFCLKPAVEEYINRSLGIDIVDEILTSSHSATYSSRSFFQYSIQKELLQEENFESFLKYISNYEVYVKDWIFQHILGKMSDDKTLCKLKTKNLQVIVDKITKATEWASKGEDGTVLPDNTESITKLISNMRKYLIKDLSIPMETVNAILFQIQSTCHPFLNSLKISINGLKEQLQDEFSDSKDISETLNQLPISPQDELFKRVFGCGQQCPFCNVPCEAGGKDHKQHHAAVHRPQGLSEYKHLHTQKLIHSLCTTEVHSDRKFSNTETQGEFHPYKDYTKYYPDWHIPPDYTIEASDYWKYVLVQNNDRFAEEYKAKPADVPEAWRSITKEQALKGLKDAFNVK
ncbi:hypothetical protein Q5P01_006978 [Channa striata]|uniref:VLIG-type G domain-containing protein n=1 Tax=Channa striata TaxID=64152 RepID=A0AA88N910_CHASR|nr:hypothetical protein Q5P01_006978 [Channa striata]